MNGFTKLWSDIVLSTIWREPNHVRLVWITMLALADKDGYVGASVPGLADVARVTVDECRDALERLRAPDPDSRTKDHEGRRIADADGGWTILNYRLHRERESAERRRTQVREAVRRHRARKRNQESNTDEDYTPESKLCKPKQKHRQKQKQSTETSSPVAAPPTGNGRTTHLTPFGDVWKTQYGGEPAYGQLGKALKPLLDTHPPEVVLAHWTRYCAETEAEYASPSRFAQTFGAWDPQRQSPKPMTFAEAMLHAGEA